ncbi:beta-N-acetylhexosaminidase [Dokdonella sp.]|uniref:beta-N-acetylhexosaminidase n=1 Tax=Dokdonella sp. TaxID=2291710 RepID=UPI002F402152
MRRWSVFGVLFVAACSTNPPARAPAPLPPLLPWPARIEVGHGHFVLRDGARLDVAGGDEALGIARAFSTRLARDRGLHLDVAATAGREAAPLVFELRSDDATLPEGEGYRLVVDGAHVELAAREPRGLFRGGTTLWQLLTAQMTASNAIDVAAVRIEDRPRFEWRGAMLDSARHFQSPEFIKRFIDELALLKLDVLHWHLTDDQGWRIQIKRHPRLTEVGAWRRPAGAAGTDANGMPVRYGGFYTQDEVRDIVRYAAERYVTIVPEIDMPGHMQAAIAAYPELGASADEPVVSADWGVHSYILNVDESTIAFMQDVLDEVIELFPSKYIHIGGDEAVKDQWKASSGVQARMRELGLADEAALQGWFIARMREHLAARGRRLVGWDEILEGGGPADAAVMSWRGTKGGIDAAKAGHPVVMAPSPDLYFDHLQSDAADEPSGRPDLRTLADIVAFDATAGMDAGAAVRVLGAQANLWTEHMRTTAMVEHAAFPRLAALAEALWSPREAPDWSRFVARLVPQMERWRAHGIAAAQSAFEVRFSDTAQGIALSNQVGLPMRYTLDGRDPDARAAIYAGGALTPPAGARIRAATWLDGRRVGDIAARLPDTAHRRASSELAQCTGKLVLRLEDDAPTQGPRAFYDVDLFDPCWIWPHAPLDDVARIRVAVGQLPYNFQLYKDVANIVPRPAPATAAGELLVRDGCAGPLLASLPLDRARMNPAVSVLEAQLSQRPRARDLCLLFSGEGHDPLWAIDTVELLPTP